MVCCVRRLETWIKQHIWFFCVKLSEGGCTVSTDDLFYSLMHTPPLPILMSCNIIPQLGFHFLFDTLHNQTFVPGLPVNLPYSCLPGKWDSLICCCPKVRKLNRESSKSDNGWWGYEGPPSFPSALHLRLLVLGEASVNVVSNSTERPMCQGTEVSCRYPRR